MKFLAAFAATAFLGASSAVANTSVIATTSNIASLVGEVGGDHVTVATIAKPSQDPHYISAKPSYMVKLSRADLVVAVGYELEKAWLPSLIRGARNPGIRPGTDGHLTVSSLIEHPLEVPKGEITRAQGDVHPDGNPHVLLDPIRAGKVAEAIAERLARLDKDHKSTFLKNAKALKKRLAKKTKKWQSRLDKSGVDSVVSHHKTLTYFFDRFGIENNVVLEAKPGVPPSAKHILGVIKTVKNESIPLIMVETYFKDDAAQKIARQVKSVRVETVPVAAKPDEPIDTLYEQLVQTVEKARKNGS